MRPLGKMLVMLGLLILAGGIVAGPAAAEPRVMGEEIFAQLIKGYTDLSQSNFKAAQKEFENIIRADFDNPYANNNLAVLMEKQGRLVDAMTYLHIGEKMAADYLYTVETVYLLGVVCGAVLPEKTLGQASQIAQVIAANKKKLAEKMASLPPETSKNSADARNQP